MRKRFRNRYNEFPEELNVWTSFTDLMSNAFMILSLFLLIVLLQTLVTNQAEEEPESTPPVLLIQDTGDFKFDSGAADIPLGLQQYIRNELATWIETNIQDEFYIVQVIGHTDGQEIGTNRSNLDRLLEEVASGNQPIQALTPGSNADLGLMRALAVVKELTEIQKTGKLKGVEFQAYSAAQLFLPESKGFAPKVRNPDATRRRIEIRFSPRGEVINAR